MWTDARAVDVEATGSSVSAYTGSLPSFTAATLVFEVEGLRCDSALVSTGPWASPSGVKD